MKIVHITVLYLLREIQTEDTMIVYAICAIMHDYVKNIHTDDVYILCKLKLFYIQVYTIRIQKNVGF